MSISWDRFNWSISSPLPNGRGGFGSVHSAVRTSDGLEAAVKQIPKGGSAERETLLADFTTTNRLPHVLEVIDTGMDEEFMYIAMPLASMSLADLLERNPGGISLDAAIEILRQIALGLTGLDGKIVHRDLKPENVLLVGSEWVIADFGISRFSEAATATATLRGHLSAPYAAPEQWAGVRCTEATDIYAFGVIAYLLVASKLPFVARTMGDWQECHSRLTPPRLDIGHPVLEVLIARCLLKSPTLRPRASEVLSTLDSYELPQSLTVGLGALAQAGKNETHRLAEQESLRIAQELAQSERLSAYEDSRYLLSMSVEPLVAAISRLIPSAQVVRDGHGGQEMVRVNVAGALIAVGAPFATGEWGGPFDVIAASAITVHRAEPTRGGWLGRSHSLWFCDPLELGDYGWFEFSFTELLRLHGNAKVDPYPLNPSEALDLFQSVTTLRSVNSGPNRVDGVANESFVDRWAVYFSDAINGKLEQPSSRPENSWIGKSTPWRRG